MPEPDIYLGVGSGSHAEQTAKIMVEFEKILQKEVPDMVIVVGDVNSTLACSIVAAKMLVPVAHVEAACAVTTARCPKKSTDWSQTRFLICSSLASLQAFIT